MYYMFMYVDVPQECDMYALNVRKKSKKEIRNLMYHKGNKK